MKIRWTRLALDDLSHAYEYISQERSSAASGLLMHFQTALLALSQYPQLGRAGRIAGTRELVIAATPYRLYYRIKNDRIEILSFLHGARRWPDSL